MISTEEVKTDTILFPDLSIFEESDEEDEVITHHVSTWAKVKIGTIQSRLEVIKERQDRRNPRIRNKQILLRLLVSLTNEIFGFNGWSSKILDCLCLTEDFNQESKTYSIQHKVMLRITLQDGTSIEAEGTGISSDSQQRAIGFSRSKKAAVSEGLRNAIIKFPSLLEM